jgi:hypothetical protein
MRLFSHHTAREPAGNRITHREKQRLATLAAQLVGIIRKQLASNQLFLLFPELSEASSVDGDEDLRLLAEQLDGQS